MSNMADFLKVISYITASYHATVNGVPLPEQANNLPGSRLNVVHSHKELYNLVGDMDEVWEVKRNIPGAHLLDVSTIAPKPKQVWDGKEVIDEDDSGRSGQCNGLSATCLYECPVLSDG